MLISVIIPAWNLWHLTSACLESLARTASPENVEIIVVDNGSTDETAAHLESFGSALFGSGFHAVRLENNLGFAKGCNLGAAAASGELLFFLNNDTIARPGWIEPMLAVMAEKRTGACGPLLLYPDGCLQHCGIAFNPFYNVRHLYEFFPGDHPLLRKRRPLQAITGAAMMLPAGLFRETGGFCEDYVNGFEDIDLCCRITRGGHKLAMAPDSVFEHHTSQTPGRFAHDNANARLLRERWGNYLKPDLHMLGLLDGYQTVIGADLSVWLETSSETAARLAAETDGSADALKEQLHKEPLWRAGWQKLVDTLAASGETALAMRAGLDALRFFPVPEILARVQNLAGKQCAAENAEAHTDDRAKHLARIRAARRDAWRRNDKILADLFDQWLARNPTS